MASAGQSGGMQALRTPEHRFRDLRDYPFAPHWTELAGGLRVNHLDEGPPATEPVPIPLRDGPGNRVSGGKTSL